MAGEKRKSRRKSDLEILEELQQRIMDELREKDINPKVGDLLKALELKMKLKLPEEEKEKIWELINQLREEELSSKRESRNGG
jgi:uncharacterized iron-regulated protein